MEKYKLLKSVMWENHLNSDNNNNEICETCSTSKFSCNCAFLNFNPSSEEMDTFAITYIDNIKKKKNEIILQTMYLNDKLIYSKQLLSILDTP